LLSCRSAARKRSGRPCHGMAPISTNCPHGSSSPGLLSLGLPITDVTATPGELPSPRRSSPRGSPSHRRVRSSFRLSLIESHYLSNHVGSTGRRGIFTGQCCRPLCVGDATKHLSGPRTVTECRPRRTSLPRLRQIPESGLPPLPKRDTPLTILTWPLRRHSLPSDPGFVPSPAPQRGRAPPHCS
jgi:hypothetical protein